MKIPKLKIVLVIAIFAMPFVTSCLMMVLFSVVTGCSEQPLPTPKELLERAGGVEKVNQEALTLFAYCSTNTGDGSGFVDLERFPTIASFSRGYGAYLERDAQGRPESIRVPTGTHAHTTFIHIYHPDQTNQVGIASNLTQVVSNIYVAK